MPDAFAFLYVDNQDGAEPAVGVLGLIGLSGSL